MVSGEILFRIRNTPPKRWRAEGYLVKFSPCGLGAELIMQNSTDRNHWGGTIGRWSWSSWSWTWSWPWLYWSPCWWLWWLWGDYAEQQWPQPFGRRGNNRSISDPEAQKHKTFRIAAFYAQNFSGRSARIHFSRHIKKRVVLSHDISKKCVTLSRH